MDFTNTLIVWYLKNLRDLPWRQTRNPYRIWLSEIMLQQTRVAQATPYYYRFLEAFPTVQDMAAADEETLLKLWQGLGYYSRARNLHFTAKQVVTEFKGEFPKTYNELLQLKGIGEYTAAAIASIAYHEPVAVVDGNVYRVLARFFGIETDIASSGAKKEFTELANTLLDRKRPAEFNQALMEFGAVHCTPKNPKCDCCVLQSACVAFRDKKTSVLPLKLKKTKVTNRYFHYLVFEDLEGKVLLEKRTEKGIWHNLYQFPLIESQGILSFEEFLTSFNDHYGKQSISTIQRINPNPILHKLSHQNLHIFFYKIQLQTIESKGIPADELNNFPVPIVIHNFISQINK